METDIRQKQASDTGEVDRLKFMAEKGHLYILIVYADTISKDAYDFLFWYE